MSGQGQQAAWRPRWLSLAVAISALAGTFILYAQPDFMLQMAQQLWFCFQ